jgi:hypothetical protein
MAGLRVEVRGGEIVVTLPGTSYRAVYLRCQPFLVLFRESPHVMGVPPSLVPPMAIVRGA